MTSVEHRPSRRTGSRRMGRCAGLGLLLAGLLCLAGAPSALAITFPYDAVPVTGSPFALGFDSFPSQVAFSPSGGLLATNVLSGVELQSVSTIGAVGAPTGPQGSTACTSGESNSFAFSPSGGVLAEAVGTGFSTKGELRTFTVSGTTLTKAYCTKLGTEGSPTAYSVAFSPAAYGGLLAVTNSTANDVSVYSVTGAGKATPLPGSPFTTGTSPGAVTFSPTGSAFDLLAVADGSNSVSMFTVGSGAVAPVPGSPFAVGTTPFSVAFSPNSALLATADLNADAVSVFSVSFTGKLTQVPGSPFAVGKGTAPSSAAFSPGGALLATADFGNVTRGGTYYGYSDHVSLFSASSAGALTPLSISPLTTGKGADAVAFSPDGFLLADADYIGNSTSVFSYGQQFVFPLPPWLIARLGAIMQSLGVGASSPGIIHAIGRALAEIDWGDGRNVAAVHLAFTHLVTGRIVGKRCVVSVGKGNFAGPTCTRTVTAETLALVAHHATRKVTVSRHRRLISAPYALTVSATAAGGLRSVPQSLPLTGPVGAAG